jgi:DNA invertase Pin-like site-specific DNA recombinase
MSGSDEERPGLWNAVDAVRRNCILVAYKLDRLAREVYLSEVITRTISKQGGKIEIVTGCENGESNENKLVRQILSAFAEYERKVTAYRTKMGMLRHQARGRRMSDLTPYGWVRDPNNPALMIEEPTEQAVITLICKMRDNGVSLRGIALNLENQNIPSRISPRWNNDGKRWNHLIIKRILSRCKFRI